MAMNAAAVHDFLRRNFSSAFGCPMQDAVEGFILHLIMVLMNHSIPAGTLRRGAVANTIEKTERGFIFSSAEIWSIS